MFRNKLIIATIFLLILLLFIWFLGPYVSVAGTTLFTTLNSKILASVILFAIWLIYSITVFFLCKAKEKTKHPFGAQGQEKLWHVIKSFKRAKNLIKEKNQPWIWLIGPVHSGKTSLTANLGADFISPSQKSLKIIDSTEECDWWISDKAIFIEPASEYALPTSTDSLQYFILENMIKLYRRMRRDNNLTNVLIAVDVAKLASGIEEIDLFALQLERSLHLFQKYSAELQITFMITQADRILGFMDYFDDLSPTEREKKFGFVLTREQNTTLPETLKSLFHTLVMRINQQLIHSLHHQPNLRKRSRMNAFPAHLEKVCEAIYHLLTRLPWSNTAQLEGVYFSSVEQKSNPVNLISQVFGKTSHLPNGMVTAAFTANKPYFLKDFFEHLSQNAYSPLVLTPQKMSLRSAAAGAGILIVLGATALWHIGYQQSVRALKKVQTEFQVIESAGTNSVLWPSQMAVLRQAISDIDQTHATDFRWLGLTQVAHLRKSMSAQYNALLTNAFQPYLQNMLENEIEDNINQNKPLEVYNALRTYLALTEKDKKNVAMIQQWFALRWHRESRNQSPQQVNFSLFIADLLKENKAIWPNTVLVNKAQDFLKKHSLAEIAYLEIQGEYPPGNVPIIDNMSGESRIDLSNAFIPAFYSSQNFNEIYDHVIPQMVDRLDKTHGILGSVAVTALTPEQKKHLINEIRKLYLKYYTQAWQNEVTNIQIKSPQNLTELKQTIQLLTETPSRLMAIAKIAFDNATLLSTPAAMNTLKEFVNQKGIFMSLKQNLDALSSYIQPALQASDTAKASYQLASERMQNQKDLDALSQLFNTIQNYPEPIRSWLTTIANSTWRILLQHSREYLNNVWGTLVLPEYEQKIKNKYPIYKDGLADISIQDFIDFFGPNGFLQAFFQNHLQPFVNISGNYWTWAHKNGQSIGISQSDLEMFLRASLIQQMFFTDTSTAPSFRFTLSLVQLSTDDNLFTLNLGGQLIEIPSNDRTIHPLTWPGPNPTFTSIRLVSSNLQSPAITFTGPWSWFKLLDESQLDPTANPREFKLIFKVGDSTASFRMVADNLINPYLPGVLSKFRCPNNL
jgi:type VI secretion system protein ImpL